MLNAGIESVPFDEAELVRIREALAVSNRGLGESGGFTLPLYEEMLGHIDDYRQLDAATDDAAELTDESTASE